MSDRTEDIVDDIIESNDFDDGTNDGDESGGKKKRKKKSRAGTVAGVDPDELKRITDNLIDLERQKREIADQIKDATKDATGKGYDSKALKKIVALHFADSEKVEQEESILDTYKHALGMG